MKIYSINNNINFGAKIKINKTMCRDLGDACGLSTVGSSLSATGATAISPVFDPAHHIHSAAKVVDAFAAFSGVGSVGAGASVLKASSDILKSGMKNINKKVLS